MTQEVKAVTIIGLITLAILGGGVFLLTKGYQNPQNAPNPTPSDNRLLIKTDSHQIATDSAKVTIVEFGDYQCPACGSAYPIIKQILKDYAGRVNFVFRNFPLPQHQNAMPAAQAAEAAGEQGKFWQMHDKLYEMQDKWSSNVKPIDLFVGYAADLGLDVDQFRSDFTASRYTDKINQDRNDGNDLGVNATPTFFINGQKVEGLAGYDDFKNKINTALLGG